MNIGEYYDSNSWDDEPLTQEEIAEVLAIHKRHKDGEDMGRRPRSKRVDTAGNSSLVRQLLDA